MKKAGKLFSVVALAMIVVVLGLTACGGGSSGPKKSLVSIDVNGFKNTFNLGEEFSIGDLSVIATYSDATTQTFTAADLKGLTIDSSAYNKNAVGNYSIIVTYQGQIGVYTVTVIDPDDPGGPIVPPDPTFSITASVLASFGSMQMPYTQPYAQTVTVTNAGEESVTLTQPTAEHYDIGLLSTETLAENGATATFTVQPKAGLAVGAYNETITINGSGGVSTTVNAVFEVTEETGGGDGSEENPFLVWTAVQLQQVGSNLNGWGLDKHYRQTANITLDGNWTRIGNDTARFTGTYDGEGFSINGLTINASLEGQGLFGYIGSGGEVRNVALRDVYITSTQSNVGGIAGVNRGVIVNCYVSGVINGSHYVGGITGFNMGGGSIMNCYTTADVAGTHHESGWVGGIVGLNGRNLTGFGNGLVSRSYATGRITGADDVGGIAGSNDTATGTIERSVALNSQVTARATDSAGRIAGTNYGTLTSNYARAEGMILSNVSGNITATSSATGIHGEDVTAANTHGANSNTWWSGTATYFASFWTFAANRLPHLITIMGGAFADTQEPLVETFSAPPNLVGTLTLTNTTPRVTDIITARYTGGVGSGEATYTWLRNGSVVIPGASGSTFTVPAGELGNTITARVSFANNSGTVSSAPTAPVAPQGPPKSVTIGAQDTQVVQGSAGLALFIVTTANIIPGQPPVGPVWYSDAAGTLITTDPPGVNVGMSALAEDNTAQIAMPVSSSNAVAGTYYFRVMFDGVQSNVGTLVILPAGTKMVRVGDQTALMQASVAGSTARFNVHTTNINPGTYTATITGNPATVSVQGSVTINAQNTGTLTLVGTISTIEANHTNLRLTIDGTQSVPFTLRIVSLLGDGTSNSPYLINNGSDLITFRTLINVGRAPYANNGMHFRLTTDIVLGGAYNWLPIGNDTNPFRGNFNGNGHTISDLIINRPTETNIGLFGRMQGVSTNLAVVRNLAVAVHNITGGNHTGGIVGRIDMGTVYNCFVRGTITGGDRTGGIAGEIIAGRIENCYSAATVTGALSVGGIAGDVTSNVIRSYATGAISGVNHVGGIVGRTRGSSATIRECVALNPSLTRTSGNGDWFYRVVGDRSTGTTLSNNAAWSGMQALGGGLSFGSWNSDINPNGLGISAAEAKTEAAYTSRNWAFGTSETSPWRWGLNTAYPLPTFHWQTTAPAFPAHLN